MRDLNYISADLACWCTSFPIILLCDDGDDCDEVYDDECEDVDDNDSNIQNH